VRALALGTRTRGRRRRLGLISGGVVGLTALVILPSSAAYADYVTSNASGLAGYAVDTPLNGTPPASAADQFQVPTVTCMKKSLVGFGVIVVSNDGHSIAAASVRATCLRGHGPAVYSAIINIDFVHTSLATTVSPGDVISTSASDTSGGASATLTDQTTGFTQTLGGAGTVSDYASTGVVDDDVSIAANHVPMFPTVTISNAQIGGANVGTYTAATGLTQFRKVRGFGKRQRLQIQPGTLGASSFPVSWLSG
jgi:hypothetical protein